jgi:hypothetical protein
LKHWLLLRLMAWVQVRRGRSWPPDVRCVVASCESLASVSDGSVLPRRAVYHCMQPDQQPANDDCLHTHLVASGVCGCCVTAHSKGCILRRHSGFQSRGKLHTDWYAAVGVFVVAAVVRPRSHRVNVNWFVCDRCIGRRDVGPHSAGKGTGHWVLSVCKVRSVDDGSCCNVVPVDVTGHRVLKANPLKTKCALGVHSKVNSRFSKHNHRVRHNRWW